MQPESDPTRGGTAVTFKEVLAQVIEWLQHDQRVSYRALKRQFTLDDAYLDDLKYELIEVQELATDREGTMLIWTGGPVATPALGVALCPVRKPVCHPGSPPRPDCSPTTRTATP